jgi:hypothetical protein
LEKDPDSDAWAWDDVVDDVLDQLILWMAFYLIEKVAISYIAVHYHYRRTNTTLKRSKNIQKALITLYEASIYLHQVNGSTFAEEDIIIRNAKGDMKASARVRVSSYLARLGLDGYKFVSFFGNFISDDPNAHWLRPGSSYAIIERAWANPTAASALARRIWLSLVPRGKYGLTENDIVEVLGLDRAAEAKSIFKTLDDNDNGEMPLDDFVGMVTEAGQKKHNVLKTIVDMDHCINTLDWLCLLIIAAVMTFFISKTFSFTSQNKSGLLLHSASLRPCYPNNPNCALLSRHWSLICHRADLEPPADRYHFCLFRPSLRFG